VENRGIPISNSCRFLAGAGVLRMTCFAAAHLTACHFYFALPHHLPLPTLPPHATLADALPAVRTRCTTPALFAPRAEEGAGGCGGV